MTGLVLFECARCGHLVTRVPIRDPLNHAADAPLWCSEDCREADAEDYWTRRWTA